MYQCLDMNGHGRLLELLAKCCRGGPLTFEDKTAGSLDSDPVIPPLRDDGDALDHSALRRVSNLDILDTPADTPHPPAPWVYFRFPRSSIRQIKSAAVSFQSPGASNHVSSNDALSAFIWQHLALARSHRFSPQDLMQLGRLVDIHQRLKPSIPTSYIGHVLLLDENSNPFGSLAREPLGAVAYQLRRSLRRYDSHYIRSLALTLRAEQDKTIFRYDASTITGKDITISSWAGLSLRRGSFGEVLGVPDFVRRHNQADCEGLIYLMPATRERDIDITMSLRTEDLEKLREDEDWNNRAEFLG